MEIDDCRKAFERWHLSQNDDEAVLNGPYDSQHVNAMFNAWKAAISNKHSDAREDCPWKCKTGDSKCLCANPTQNLNLMQEMYEQMLPK